MIVGQQAGFLFEAAKVLAHSQRDKVRMTGRSCRQSVWRSWAVRSDRRIGCYLSPKIIKFALPVGGLSVLWGLTALQLLGNIFSSSLFCLHFDRIHCDNSDQLMRDVEFLKILDFFFGQFEVNRLDKAVDLRFLCRPDNRRSSFCQKPSK